MALWTPEKKRGAIIVTGASRGIGAAVAKLVGALGVPVVVNFLSAQAEAVEVVEQITAAGGQAIAVQGDVAREADVIRLFETAARAFGTLQGLVNNAGITGGFARVETVTEAALTRMLAVNVTGTILCAREAVRRMSTRHGGTGGAIVNISSLAARTGGAGEWVHYAASKGAINSFTIGLAREVAEEGIRVNAVAPGLIETDLHATNGAPDRPARLAPTIPMRRAGTANEVAEGCCGCFLQRPRIPRGRSWKSVGGDDHGLKNPLIICYNHQEGWAYCRSFFLWCRYQHR